MRPPPSPAAAEQRRLGVLMVLGGGACLSLGGVALRLLESAGGWQVLFYRALSFTLTLALYLVAVHGRALPRALLATGREGAAVALLLGVGSVCYVFAVLMTTVANAVFVISSTPLFTALLALAVLGERVAPATWLAMTAALVGIGLMLADGLATGGIFGIVAAFGVVATQAGMIVTLRRVTGRDMLPALCCAGIVTAAIAAPMVDGFAMSTHDLAISVLMGAVQFGGGFILITLGTRYVSAAEVALLALTETVLGPLWVWAGVGEVPSVLTLAGGAVVVGAVAGRALAGLRGARR